MVLLMAFLLIAGACVGYAFRGVIGREKAQLGQFVMDRAKEGEMAAQSLWNRSNASTRVVH